MPDLTDQSYLLNDQYRDASNLNARIRLHQLYSVRPRSLHGWIFDTLLDLEGIEEKRILEIGCGPGQLWLNNIERVPPAWDITLSDFSPGMLGEAQHNLSGTYRPFSFVLIDAQDVPYPDETFDIVVANYMLYHVPDRPKAIRELARVLRAVGRLYAATPGLGHMRELDELVQRFDPSAGRMGGNLISSFALENGAEQLAESFSQVESYRFEEGQKDGLVVTEAGPLVDYILSAAYSTGLSAADRPRLTQYVESLIARDGAIRIGKESGMFVAVKAGNDVQ